MHTVFSISVAYCCCVKVSVDELASGLQQACKAAAKAAPQRTMETSERNVTKADSPSGSEQHDDSSVSQVALISDVKIDSETVV